MSPLSEVSVPLEEVFLALMSDPRWRGSVRRCMRRGVLYGCSGDEWQWARVCPGRSRMRLRERAFRCRRSRCCRQSGGRAFGSGRGFRREALSADPAGTEALRETQEIAVGVLYQELPLPGFTGAAPVPAFFGLSIQGPLGFCQSLEHRLQ